MQSLAATLIRFRWPLLLIGMVCLIVAYPASTRLTMDRSVASLFGDDDPTFVDYRRFKKIFGANEAVIVMYRDDSLATSAGMDRNRQFGSQIRQLPGVASVVSPAVLNDSIGLMNPVNLLGGKPDIPALMDKSDPMAVGLDTVFGGYTHSANHTRAAIVALLEAGRGTATAQTIRQIASQWPETHEVSEVSVVGEPVLINDAFDLIERDGDRLAFWTVGLLSAVVLITLMDLRFVAIAALTIVWSVVVTRALMFSMGVSLSLIASILTAIATVIAVASVLHLGVRFHRMRFRGQSVSQSGNRALADLMAPIFWTCLTDAAGFAALFGSQILPVRQFGLMVAVSAMCVLTGLILFSPALISLPSFGVAVAGHRRRRAMTRRLRRMCFRVAVWFIEKRGSVTLVFSAIALLAIWLVSGSETETSFLKNFRSKSRIVIDYARVENDLGGAGVWDIILPAPEEITPEYVQRVLALEKDLRSINVDGATITKSISVADTVDVFRKSPALSLMPIPLRMAAMKQHMPAFINALLSPPNSDGVRSLRIMLRSQEGLGAGQKRALIEAVEQLVADSTSDWVDQPASEPTSIVTGYYVIMARLVDQLIADQWRCFGASVALIWVLMCLATRSFRYAAAALIPNLVPVFLVLAVVAMLGEKINMGAAMIAAVSVGLSIDGSVHFLAAYQSKRLRGHSAAKSAASAAAGIGVPVLLATAALVIGFSVLSSSEFVPTATFGILVAATMVAGTVINLTLLPVMVVWVDRGETGGRAASVRSFAEV